MDTERPHGEIAPDALDLAIQAALDVDPSPEFLARVRARIADEPPARRWTITLIPVAAAAATFAILALLVVNTSRHPVSEPVRPTTARADGAVGSIASAALPEPAPYAPPAPDTPQVRGSVTPRPARAAATTRLSDEARGLQALVNTINRGNVIVVADDNIGRRPTEIRDLEIATLTIPSISVEPIAPVAQ